MRTAPISLLLPVAVAITLTIPLPLDAAGLPASDGTLTGTAAAAPCVETGKELASWASSCADYYEGAFCLQAFDCRRYCDVPAVCDHNRCLYDPDAVPNEGEGSCVPAVCSEAIDCLEFCPNAFDIQCDSDNMCVYEFL